MEENGTLAAVENAAPDSTTAVSASTARVTAVPTTSRRGLMVNALTGAAFAAGAGALLAGCGSGGSTSPIGGQNGANFIATPTPSATPNPTPSPTPTPLDPTRLADADILNFALNLEYLEAEFYLRAVGSTLSSSEAGGSTAGTVTGGRSVNFSNSAVQQYAQEIASDERNHVNFLRTALGSSAVVRPQIDFTTAFNSLAQAAGFGSFDPFADDNSFILGSFVFEDVGVTAYKGAAKYIKTKSTLGAAASILAVEAIHAGLIRQLIADIGGATLTRANQISAVRAAAGGGKDEAVGVTPGFNGTNSPFNFVPAQNNIAVYSRTFAEVLRIVYLTPSGFPAAGGFFPAGTNGTIKQAA